MYLFYFLFTGWRPDWHMLLPAHQLTISDPCLGLNLESVVHSRLKSFNCSLSFRRIELPTVLWNKSLALLGRQSVLNHEPGYHAIGFQPGYIPSEKVKKNFKHSRQKKCTMGIRMPDNCYVLIFPAKSH